MLKTLSTISSLLAKILAILLPGKERHEELCLAISEVSKRCDVELAELDSIGAEIHEIKERLKKVENRCFLRAQPYKIEN